MPPCESLLFFRKTPTNRSSQIAQRPLSLSWLEADFQRDLTYSGDVAVVTVTWGVRTPGYWDWSILLVILIGVGNMSLKENDAVGIAVQCKAPKRPACLPSAARRPGFSAESIHFRWEEQWLGSRSDTATCEKRVFDERWGITWAMGLCDLSLHLKPSSLWSLRIARER